MRKMIVFVFVLISAMSIAQKHDYKVIQTFHIPSPGGWDYISVNKGRVYASHGTQVNILDENTGDSLGVILNTNGVHGIAFDNSLNTGYTSNGRSNTVTVFDLTTNQVLGEIPTGENPDAIMFEPFTKTVVTCNGRSKTLSIIDVHQKKVIGTIDVGGKPETAVSDGKGKVFVNIEDKNEIIEVNMKTNNVEHHWTLTPGESPTGLEYDSKTRRLFAGCQKLLVVMDAENGKIVDRLPIGNGCDGVAFDSKNNIVFTSNGEGTITAVKENDANSYSVLGNYVTKRGARTIAIDAKNGKLFLPTAEFEPAAPAGGRPKMIPGTFQVIVVE